MIRAAAIVLCSAIAVAQAPQENPFDTASQAYWQTRQKGQYEVATAQREEMNRLLQTQAPGDPPFAGRAQTLAQIYDGDGMSAKSRAVLEEALARAQAAGASGPARASLLVSLASFWERDRNLLKSVAYMEQAVAVAEQTPQTEDRKAAPTSGWVVGGQTRAAFVAFPGTSRVGAMIGPFGAGFSPTLDRTSLYTRLADLYQRLGRHDQAAAVLAKIKALPAQPDNWNLAQYYQQHGELDQAVAIYKKQMEESAADPQQMLVPAQSLAGVYEQQKRPDEAAAVLQEAVTSLEALGKPELAAQTAGLRQRLATLLYQNGHTEAADQAFPPPADSGAATAQPTVSYANYLGATKRAAQGEALLADYLAAHPGLNASEQGNILVSLANLAGYAGDSKRAEEYSREATQKFQPKEPPAEVVLIQPTLQKAQAAASAGNTAEAIALVAQAIAQSANARDRDALARMAPSLANAISTKASVQADELFRNISELTQSWSADTMSPWLVAMEGYPRFLMSQQRAGEVPPAIARYQAALKTARGPDTGWLEDPLRLTIDMERGRNSPQAAIPAAQNLLALEEALDGPMSEPGYRAVETLADLYRSTNDSARALPFYQQAISIADSIFRADDSRRTQPRMNAATLLIAERRLDEAEQVVLEGMALPAVTPTRSGNGFSQLLEQIHALQKSR